MTDPPATAKVRVTAPPLDRAKVAIVVVAYNAATTLSGVLDRIPDTIWERVEEVIVFDDSSQDDTYLIALGYREHARRVKLSVFRNDENLGYGGNQKRAYRYSIDKGYDVVAMLHGDGQYAPERLSDLLAPLERGEADAVFGSRMLVPGSARTGGMPLYKYVGNRILTGMENFMLGMGLSEFHSGYRLYSLRALDQIPFERNSDDFHFDTEIIIQLQAAGMRIVELPIPTYYGDEICYVNGMQYAWNVTKAVLRYKAHEFGVRADPVFEVDARYQLKRSPLSSHARILQWCGDGPRDVLDIGCGSGELARILVDRGHRVLAIDEQPPTVELPEFLHANLSEPLPIDSDRRFDIVLLADVLEHLSAPAQLLRAVRHHMRPEAQLLVSLPNVVHWSVRGQVALGRFEYANKGLLDRGHLRFFTRASAERLFAEGGFRIEERCTTPVPWENVTPPALGDGVSRTAEQVDFFLSRWMPNLFGYQHLFVLKKV